VSDVGTGGAGIRLQLFKSSFCTCRAKKRGERYTRGSPDISDGAVVFSPVIRY
jgi:hypothetical protein